MGPRGRRGNTSGQRGREKTSSNSSRHKSNETSKRSRRGRAESGPAAQTDDPSKAQKKTGSIPIPLQQLLLDVFRAAFLWRDGDSGSSLAHNIQTLKDHLYRRDFASAFANSSGELLKAYALRWSAGRALGYADIFWNVPEILPLSREEAVAGAEADTTQNDHIVCIGGGAGAEVVALAAIRRALSDQRESRAPATSCHGEPSDMAHGVSKLSLDNSQHDNDGQRKDDAVSVFAQGAEDPLNSQSYMLPHLSLTAVDIADWSLVLKDLSNFICSKSVPSIKSCPGPLLPQTSYGDEETPFTINFRQEDILNISDERLKSILFPRQTIPSRTVLVTLMFTLNELFSTSMSKTVAFLLQLTGLVEPGTILLVVDSPGSYSTVSLGATKPSEPSSSSPTSPDTKGVSSPSDSPEEGRKSSQRKYPMRFLLEHTLISVAAGRWEPVFSDESRWFRRNQSALRYDLGDGIGLEDMRYQIHVYRKCL